MAARSEVKHHLYNESNELRVSRGNKQQLSHLGILCDKIAEIQPTNLAASLIKEFRSERGGRVRWKRTQAVFHRKTKRRTTLLGLGGAVSTNTSRDSFSFTSLC